MVHVGSGLRPSGPGRLKQSGMRHCNCAQERRRTKEEIRQQIVDENYERFRSIVQRYLPTVLCRGGCVPDAAAPMHMCHLGTR